MCGLLACVFVHGAVGVLKVSPNKRFLVQADGTPFFYLGDTAWELFHRLNREDTERYLENRRAKGFTVIQAVALAEMDGLDTPNMYGEKPLIGNDPTKPNDAYFKHVDWVVDTAAKKGLYIGFLPTWGDKVVKEWGKGPVVFDASNARVYGRFLGARYKDRANIIWILGGDRRADGFEPVWRAMAEGIKEGGSNHLMTYHPWGGRSSSEFLHKEAWLDFNMLQSGHSHRDGANYKMIAKDYALEPVKPTLDGEPRYENHPVNWKPDENGWFDQFDVRQAAYWGVFAGGLGITYGCHDIWQMRTAEREPVGLARGIWSESIDLPGAGQMLHLKSLMLSRPYLSRVPDNSLIAAGQADGADHVEATRGDGYAFVYVPTGKPVTLDLSKVGAAKVKASWYDPRTGKSSEIGTYDGKGTHEFKPAGQPARGNDWVIVLDDAAKQFGKPGAVK
jgi:hypothetical protein